MPARILAAGAGWEGQHVICNYGLLFFSKLKNEVRNRCGTSR
jgi:hypothetical protein